ncbi:MAG: hypothetical protein AAFV95_03280 [Bacteroidota bacterium]
MFIGLATGMAIVLFSGCLADTSYDLRPYYFPLEQLQNGLAYEYQPVGELPLAPEYWYYRTVEQDSQLFLAGQYYDHDFTVRQLSSEKIVDNGSLLHNYFLYAYTDSDSLLTIPVDIEVNNSFPFQVSKVGSIFLSRLKWADPQQDSMKTTLIRNRQFLGDTTYTIGGQRHECVAFRLKELVETEQEGFQEVRYDGIEFYAKNIGLVYYRKEISDELTLEYELADRYPMAELVRKSEARRSGNSDL